MGKLGKPQKSKKHRKIKKTFDTAQESDALAIGSSRTKLQNLPVEDADLDRQDMPRKVRELIQSKAMIGKKPQKKKEKQRKKLKGAVQMEYGMTRPFKPVPEFKQGKYEKRRDFIRRVDIEAKRAVKTVQMEEKYKIDLTDATEFSNVKRNSQLPGSMGSEGKKKLTKKEKQRLRKIETYEQKLMKVKRKSSERKIEKDKERKKKKLEGKKMKKMEKSMDFRSLKDEVAFGEVAMQPPSLSAVPRKASTDNSKPRPGKKSLLLKDMMSGTRDASSDVSSHTSDVVIHKPAIKSQAQRPLGQSMKRKHLSPAQQQITDAQRQKAIDMYRQMRDKKYLHNNLNT